MAATIAALEATFFAINYFKTSKRQVLLDEFWMAPIANCEMERFGADADGGYLLCANLMDDVRVAYSFGIEGRDSWGCEVSRRYGVEVHEYDCFDLDEPSCPGGVLTFHPECVGGTNEVIDGRDFYSLAHQIGRNGDDGVHLVVKMDVEGSEWDSLLAAPDSVLSRIDQLIVEFHRVDDERYPSVIRKLKRHFYVINVHVNNFSCRKLQEPFPAAAFEVLFVNKRLAELHDTGEIPPGPHPLDAPNAPGQRDCQI
jgi:hypothetical protein